MLDEDVYFWYNKTVFMYKITILDEKQKIIL